MLKSFNIEDDSNNFQSHMKFFSYDLDNSNDFIQWLYVNNVKIKSKETDFLSTFKSYLNKDNIRHFVYDTGIGNVDLSVIKNYITTTAPKITLLTPLNNLWDPASTSVKVFQSTLLAYTADQPILKNSFINKNTDSPSYLTKNNWRPKRNNLIDEKDGSYQVTYNDDDEDNPILLTFFFNNKSMSIPISQGYSVNELSIILDKYINTDINDEIETTLDTSNLKQSADRVKYIGDLYQLLFDLFEPNGVDRVMRRSTIIKILLDMKKSGDWGQINWVSQWNSKKPDNKSLFISGDKLCALQSILSSNPTIFGVPRTMTNKIRNLFKGHNPLLLGYFSGPRSKIDQPYINSELIHSSNLLPELFTPVGAGVVPNLKSFEEIKTEFAKYSNINEIFNKELDEFKSNPNSRINDVKVKPFIKSLTLLEILFGDNYDTIENTKPIKSSKLLVKYGGIGSWTPVNLIEIANT